MKSLSIKKIMSIFFLFLTSIMFPAYAWKPAMHVYLSEQALNDASDGSVAVDISVDYWAGKHNQNPPSAYEVDPQILMALKNHPAHFRAGAIGPDAYPDMLTGQSIIHPLDTNRATHTFHQGSDAWLNMLWEKAKNIARQGDLRPLAFVFGFLTHAAGDMYAHTFVNYYAGGPFELGENAVTHIIVEGYVGLRSPNPTFELSIDGIEDFIYHNMIDTTTHPRTHITSLYEAKSGSLINPSLPWFFSTLRSELQRYIEDWRALPSGPEKWSQSVTTIPYSKAWIKDIDRGLRRLPKVSTDVAVSLMFNQAGGANIHKATQILDDYFDSYVISMLGVPDIIADLHRFREKIMERIEHLIPDPFAALERRILDWLVENATGNTRSEWESYFSDPQTHMTTWPKLASQGFCGSGSVTACKDEIDNRMGIGTNDFFNWREFPAAFNTVIMIKLAMLSTFGRKKILTDLGFPQDKTLRYFTPTGGVKDIKNAMIGFIKSLDHSTQWNMHPQQMVMHFDCYAYQKIFLNQKGDDVNKPYSYQSGGSSYVCQDVQSVEFLSADRQDPTYCNDEILGKITLNRPAGAHGAIVELKSKGPIIVPRTTYVKPGDISRVKTFHLRPVGQNQQFVLHANRESTHAEQWIARPAGISLPTIKVRRFAGWESIKDKETVLGGSMSRIIASLNCKSYVANRMVKLELCPASDPMTCESTKIAPFDVWETKLPYVEEDSDYLLRSTYNGKSVEKQFTLLASRVNSITLNPSSAINGLRASATKATIELFSPAKGDEEIKLSSVLPLSSEPLIIVPSGKRVINFNVSAKASNLQASCDISTGWLEAISKLDYQKYGPGVTERERYAEFLGYGSSIGPECYGLLEPIVSNVGDVITGQSLPTLEDIPTEDPDWGSINGSFPPFVRKLLGKLAKQKQAIIQQQRENLRLKKALEKKL